MLNVDFNSHVASKSEFPLPAITILISLFVRMRMLLLVCIWGLVKKCILCPLERREKRGAVSYCFCVFLNYTDTKFCSVGFFFFFPLIGVLSAGNYFYPPVLAPPAPFLVGKKWVRAFGLQLCLQKNSVVAFGLVLYGFPKKRRKKGN